jgi:hypothetical protein
VDFYVHIRTSHCRRFLNDLPIPVSTYLEVVGHVLTRPTGQFQNQAKLPGMPDENILNKDPGHFYIAIGNPGNIEAYAASTLARIQTIPMEQSAHTKGFELSRNKIYAFLPQTHKVIVFIDQD